MSNSLLRAALVGAAVSCVGAMEGAPAYWAHFAHGPSSDPNVFPIAVWLQSPGNAPAYQAIGVNTFIGLWAGPTDAQLSGLATAGVRAMGDQNATGLAHIGDATIDGWTQQDEPDNAQDDGHGGYGPPVLPSVIVANCTAWRAADATRPVYLNVGQGAAYTDYIGRGTRTGHTEDYAQYFAGADIVSFDIYPVNSPYPAVAGKLEYVALGVDHLTTWSGGTKPVFCWLETTRIGADSPAGPTPAQTRTEAWMAIIHGANGIGYFCHSWVPSFDEAALLHDAAMKAGVAALNARIQSLAAVINAPTASDAATLTSSAAAVPIDALVKRSAGKVYVFACAMRGAGATAHVTIPGATSVEVIDESRTITPDGAGRFDDAFAGYQVHLYRATLATGGTTTGGSSTGTTTGGSSGGGTTTGGTSGGGSTGGGTTTGSASGGASSGGGHHGCGRGGAAMALAAAAIALVRRVAR